MIKKGVMRVIYIILSILDSYRSKRERDGS